MIEKEDGQWKLCQYKVLHESHGNEQIHYTNDKSYWRDTVAQHDHLTDLRFEEMNFTSEQRERLEELNQMDISESYMSVSRDMVREGIQADDPRTELRVRSAVQAIEQEERELEDEEKEREVIEQNGMELEDVDSKYRDQVRERLNR